MLIIGIVPIKMLLDTWALSDSVAGPSQRNHARCSSSQISCSLSGGVQLERSHRVRYGAMFACILASFALGMSLRRVRQSISAAARQLALPLVTIASVLGLAFLMNYSGATATLGLAFAATGAGLPFFSSPAGMAGRLPDRQRHIRECTVRQPAGGDRRTAGSEPGLMAASNSSGGVMGKMISLQSIAVAAAASGMPSSDESKLFRFTLRHSIFLASVLGLITAFYAYVAPTWVR